MKRFVLPALVFLALSARATVYQPGLWFIHDDTHEQINPSTYPSIAAMAGAAPCQGVFMEYTETVSTNKEPWTTSFGQSGTNAYNGAIYTWHLYEGFGYEGTFFVEKGKSYTIAKWHGRYMRVKVDGNVLFSDEGWFNTPNGTYTAAASGWVPFELRAGINGETGVGPLNRSFGTGFNTEGVTLKNRSDTAWALPPWQKFIDPGDCSLFRIVKSETDYMTLDSVAMDGDNLAVVASFADVPSAGVLTAFWGPSDGGDLPSAWAHSSVLGTVAAGSAPGVAYTISGAADANFVALRLQRTDYATEPYTQFTAAAPVPKPVPTFDLSCDDVGYTNLTFTAVVASVGIGATAIASASVEIATDDAFSHIVTNLPLSLVDAGSETVYTSGLVSNTVYYARVAGTNNATVSNVSETVGPLQTLLPKVDPLLKKFRYEKDERYEDHGQYVSRLLQTTSNTERCFIQAYVGDNRLTRVKSYYYGSGTLIQNSVELCLQPNEDCNTWQGSEHHFSTSSDSEASSSSRNIGGFHSILTLEGDPAIGLLAFIASQPDAKDRVRLHGNNAKGQSASPYTYFLSKNDKAALVETLQLATLFHDIHRLEEMLNTSQRRIETLNKKDTTR